MGRTRALVVGLVAGIAGLGVPGHATADPIPEGRDAQIGLVHRLTARERTTVRPLLPWRANVIGVSFVGSDPHARDVAVTARAFSRGSWSEWYTLGVEADEAADRWERLRASPRIFTAPQWVGHADSVEVRVEAGARALPIGDVRLHVINSSGDADRPNPVVRAVRAIGRFLNATAVRPAEANPGTPDFVTRKEWGADEDLRSKAPGNAPSLKMAFIHHTVNSNSYSKSESDDLVRGIYRYHTLGRDYSDIAYNFLVDRYGQIFEGRWGGIDEPVIGAHTLGFNTGSTGVALIGTFTSSAPPSAMRSGLRKLLAWKLDVHYIPPVGKVTMTSGGNDRYDEGEKVSFHRISGHRDGTSTTCPGWETYERLPSIRESVDETGRPKIYLPTISDTTLRPDDDGRDESITIDARFSQTVNWAVSFRDSDGVVRRKRTGRNASIDVTWTGKTADGERVPSGRYTWKLTATDSSGHPATPASGALYVITRHPEGTYLLDGSGRYVVDDGDARPASRTAALGRFGDLPYVRAGDRERLWYGDGTPLGIRRGTLFEGPDGTRYIYSDGALRSFTNNGTGDRFALLGYDEEDLIPVSESFVSSMPDGAPVTDPTLHPDGTVVKDAVSGQKWFIDDGEKRPMTTLARRSRYRATEVVAATPGDLELDEGDAYGVRPGTLVEPTDGGTPWLVSGSGSKRRFITWTLFGRMGFTSAMLVESSSADLGALPTGSTYG